MSYKRQTEPDRSVTFLGAKIRKLHNGHIILFVFDKTKERNFPVIRTLMARQTRLVFNPQQSSSAKPVVTTHLQHDKRI